MKKIAYKYMGSLDILDPKEYIIIKEDNQYISDKYIDYYGKKMNEYKRKKVLKKGDVVIRRFYYIKFWDDDISAFFRKFKYYKRYRNDYRLTPELKQSIRTKNSILDYFDNIKKQIVNMFSKNIEIEIK